MKIEQESKENILKSLSKDLMTTFNNSVENMSSRFTVLMEEWKQRFEDTNDRITQEAKSAKEEIFLLKKELIETINQNDEDKNIKIDDMKKKLKILKKKTKKYKLSNQAMFEDISKTFNNKFEDILSKHDTTNSNINDIIANSQHDKAELKKKIDELSSNLIVKVKLLEINDQNLLERTKDLDQNIICIFKIQYSMLSSPQKRPTLPQIREGD